MGEVIDFKPKRDFRLSALEGKEYAELFFKTKGKYPDYVPVKGNYITGRVWVKYNAKK